MLKTGKYVKISKHPTIATKAGTISLEILSMLSPDIAEATKRLIP